MRYRVTGYRQDEGVVSRLLEAGDAGEAAGRLTAEGYRLIAARPAWGSTWQRQPAFDLLLFSQQLHALLAAGLSLVEALAALGEEHRNSTAGNVISALGGQLRLGKPFSAALQAQATRFPPLFVALVAASERTGDLSEALRRFIDYRSRMDALRQQLLGAALYPALLLGVGSLVMLFLLLHVVPRFGRVYAGLGGEIPLMSRLMLDLGGALDAYGLPLLLAVVMLAVLWWLMPRERRGRPGEALLAALLSWRLLAPLRDLYRQFVLAGFYRTLAVLLAGGMPLVAALDQARGLLDAGGQGALGRVLARVRAGESLSASLAAAGLAPPIALHLLRTGERAGDLPAKLDHVAGLLDRQVARRTEWLARLLEPALTLAIGVLVGFVVVLLYLPIFELAGRLE